MADEQDKSSAPEGAQLSTMSWQQIQGVLLKGSENGLADNGFNDVNTSTGSASGAASPASLALAAKQFGEIHNALLEIRAKVNAIAAQLTDESKWKGEASRRFKQHGEELQASIESLATPMKKYDEMLSFASSALMDAISDIQRINQWGAQATRERYESEVANWQSWSDNARQIGGVGNPVVEAMVVSKKPDRPQLPNGVWTPSAYPDINNRMTEMAQQVARVLEGNYRHVTQEMRPPSVVMPTVDTSGGTTGSNQFAELDANGDGQVTADELNLGSPGGVGGPTGQELLGQLDTDGNGTLSPEELASMDSITGGGPNGGIPDLGGPGGAGPGGVTGAPDLQSLTGGPAGPGGGTGNALGSAELQNLLNGGPSGAVTGTGTPGLGGLGTPDPITGLGNTGAPTSVGSVTGGPGSGTGGLGGMPDLGSPDPITGGGTPPIPGGIGAGGLGGGLGTGGLGGGPSAARGGGNDNGLSNPAVPDLGSPDPITGELPNAPGVGNGGSVPGGSGTNSGDLPPLGSPSVPPVTGLGGNANIPPFRPVTPPATPPLPSLNSPGDVTGGLPDGGLAGGFGGGQSLNGPLPTDIAGGTIPQPLLPGGSSVVGPGGGFGGLQGGLQGGGLPGGGLAGGGLGGLGGLSPVIGANGVGGLPGLPGAPGGSGSGLGSSGGMGGGMPFMPMGGGMGGPGGGKQDERERVSWLGEDRDMWGNVDGIAPRVVRAGDAGEITEPEFIVLPEAEEEEFSATSLDSGQVEAGRQATAQ